MKVDRLAVMAACPIGFEQRLEDLRSRAKGRGSDRHTKEFIEAVLDTAAKSKQDQNDPRDFIKAFLDRPTFFSNTPVGLAALRFEAWMIEKKSPLYPKLIETLAENGKPDFLAVFEGKLDETQWQRLRRGVADFVALTVIAEAGQVSKDHYEVSDLTWVRGQPVKSDTVSRLNQVDTSIPVNPVFPAVPIGSIYTAPAVRESDDIDIDAQRKANRAEFGAKVGFAVLSPGAVSSEAVKAGIPAYKNTAGVKRSGVSVSKIPGKHTHVMAEWKNAGVDDHDYEAKSKELESHFVGKGYVVARPFPDKTLLAIRKPIKEDGEDLSFQTEFTPDPNSIQGRWGTWQAVDQQDGTVGIEFFRPAKRFTLAQSISEVQALIDEVTAIYPAKSAEADLVAERYMLEYAMQNGSEEEPRPYAPLNPFTEAVEDNSAYEKNYALRESICRRNANLRRMLFEQQALDDALPEIASVHFRTPVELVPGLPLYYRGRLIGEVTDSEVSSPGNPEYDVTALVPSDLPEAGGMPWLRTSTHARRHLGFHRIARHQKRKLKRLMHAAAKESVDYVAMTPGGRAVYTDGKDDKETAKQIKTLEANDSLIWMPRSLVPFVQFPVEESDTVSLLPVGESMSAAEAFGPKGELNERFDGKAVGKPDDLEPLKKYYTQWIKSGNTYEPAGDVDFAESLKATVYQVGVSLTGPYFKRVKPQTDELYRFPNSVMESVLEEVDKFWDSKEAYDKLKVLHNRGIILYGPPGNGKTCLLHQVAEMIAQRGDVAVYAKNIGDLRACLGALRQIEPDRKIVVFLEDADEYANNYQERDFLQLLDGEESVNDILYVATTNYIERFPKRLLRPGRFDKKIYVPTPPLEGRLAFFQNKLKTIEEGPEEIERLAKETDGMSFGHLRELLISIYALKEPADDALARLKNDSNYVQESVEGIHDLSPLRFKVGDKVRTEVGAGVVVGLAGGGKTDHFGVSAPREYIVKLSADAKHGYAGKTTNFDEDDVKAVGESVDEATFAAGMALVMEQRGGWKRGQEENTWTNPKYPGVTASYRDNQFVFDGADAEVSEAIQDEIDTVSLNESMSLSADDKEKLISLKANGFKFASSPKLDKPLYVNDKTGERMLMQIVGNPAAATHWFGNTLLKHLPDAKITQDKFGRWQVSEDEIESMFVTASIALMEQRGGWVRGQEETWTNPKYPEAIARRRENQIVLDGANAEVFESFQSEMDLFVESGELREYVINERKARNRLLPAGPKPVDLKHLTPDDYKRVVGQCPDGWHYGTNSKKCVPNRTFASVARHVGSEIKTAVQAGPAGAVHAAKHVAHGAAHAAAHMLKSFASPAGAAMGAASAASMAGASLPVVGAALGTAALAVGYSFAKDSKSRAKAKNFIVHAIKTEGAETVHMVKTVGRLLTGQSVTTEDKVKAVNQAVDLCKVAAGTAILASWAHGGIHEFAKEISLPYDDMVGLLLDKPLRAATEHHFGSLGKHGLLPSAAYGESAMPGCVPCTEHRTGYAEYIEVLGSGISPELIEAASLEMNAEIEKQIREALAKDPKASAASILMNIINDAAAHPPTANDIRQALKGKVDLAKLEAALKNYKPGGASESRLPGRKGTFPASDGLGMGKRTPRVSKGLKTNGESDTVSIHTPFGEYPVEHVTEMSLNRVRKHLGSSDGFMMLSADRSERSPGDNAKHQAKLEAHLRSRGKGFVKVKGGYVEKTAEGDKPVYEHSYLVPNVSKDEAREFAKHALKHHNQEAVLHGGKEGVHLMYGKDHRREKVGETFTTGHLHQYFTEWHHRRFGFKGGSQQQAASDPTPYIFVEYIPNGQMSAMLFELELKGIDRALKHNLMDPPEPAVVKRIADSVLEGGTTAFYAPDVQDYYDMQIMNGKDSDEAKKLTKEKFDIKDLEVGPTGKIASDEVDDGPPTPSPAPDPAMMGPQGQPPFQDPNASPVDLTTPPGAPPPQQFPPDAGTAPLAQQ